MRRDASRSRESAGAPRARDAEREARARAPRRALVQTRQASKCTREATNTRHPPPGRKKQRRDVASRGVIIGRTGSIVDDLTDPLLSVPRRVGKKSDPTYATRASCEI